MNSRSDDHELRPSASRVSASSRYSRPPPVPIPSSFDYGANDQYRAVSPASSRASAKSGINGRTYEDDDDSELGLSSRSAPVPRRTAAKRSGSDSARAPLPPKKDYKLEERTHSGGSTTSSLSNSAKDRPWRTSASNSSAVTRVTSGTSGYVTANATSHTDREDDFDGDSLGDEKDALNESYDMEVTSDRWSQYETPDLAEESRRATSNAVVEVATRMADRQHVEPAPVVSTSSSSVMGGSAGEGIYRNDPDNLEGLEALEKNWDYPPTEREDMRALERNGNSLPPGPPSGAFRSTNIHASVPGSSSRSTTDYVKSRLSALVTHRNSRSQSDDYERQLSTSSVQSDHDKVRNEALKMLQIADSCLVDSPRNSSASNSPRNSISPTTGLFRTAGGGLAMRELHDDEAGRIRVSQEKGEKTSETKRGAVASIAGLDKFRSEKSRFSSKYDGTFTIGSQDEDDLKLSNSNGNPVSPNEETPSTWSSRYSVERQLMAITGGLDSTRMLAKMDMLHSSREKTKSARGMYRASGYAMDGSGEEYGDYTRSSSTHGAGMSGVWLWLRGTLWSDDPELNYDGTTQSLVRREKAMQRRRRFRWAMAFVVCLSVAVGILGHMGNHPRKSVHVTAGANDVDFYVMSDEPYDFSDTEQLTRELEALRPLEAEFIVHLGNANGDVQSQCQEYGFERAAAVLKESPVPVLVIPGDLDWAACGSRKKAERSLEWWDVNLGRLERHWDHPLKVDYSDDVVGNFAFLHKDVLFVSVSIVDAETRSDEVTTRQEKNVMWTLGKLDEHERDGYRAVVILGHAPPSERQDGYFLPVVERVKMIGKPVLYLHANSDGSFQQYAPFDEAENFKAVQLEKRGREAPMRVVVAEGRDDAFVFERRDPTMERIQK